MAALLTLLLSAALLGLSAAKHERQKRQVTYEPYYSTPDYDNALRNACSFRLFEVPTWGFEFSSKDVCSLGEDRYPDNADWRLEFNLPEQRNFINIQYNISIESHPTCAYDKLTFAVESSFEPVIICGNRAGQFSLPWDPTDGVFIVTFTSDSSVTLSGFNFQVYASNDLVYPYGIVPLYNGDSNNDNWSSDYNPSDYYTDNWSSDYYPSDYYTDNWSSDYYTDNWSSDYYPSDYYTDNWSNDYYPSDYYTDNWSSDYYPRDYYTDIWSSDYYSYSDSWSSDYYPSEYPYSWSNDYSSYPPWDPFPSDYNYYGPTAVTDVDYPSSTDYNYTPDYFPPYEPCSSNNDQHFQTTLQQLRSELDGLKYAVEEAQAVLVNLSTNLYDSAYPYDQGIPFGKKK